MNSIIAVSKFINDNGIPKDNFGNCYFEGYVEYKSNVGNQSVITKVTFIGNGFNDGDIRLEEAESIQAQDYHLDFNTTHQTYSYNSSNKSLSIKGKSKKMGGEYNITIKSI